MHERRKALLLAVMLDCNIKTSLRILDLGADCLKSHGMRQRAKKILPKMRLAERMLAQICGES